MSDPNKPESVCGDLRNLPSALTSLVKIPHWVLWRWKQTKNKADEVKWTKVPYQPDGTNAKNNDPKTWNSYTVVVDAMPKFDGIGFCLFNSDFGAFDIDHCRNPQTGELDPWAADLVERVASYTEVTVSGTGLRIIGEGSGPKLHRKLPVSNGVSLEAYRKAERYIVITGNPLNGFGITNIDEHLDTTVAWLDAKKDKADRESKANGQESPGGEGGDKLERIIRLGENGEFKGDKSNAVWFVVCEMLRQGYVDTSIVSTLLDRANKISVHVYAQPKPREYAERQIAKAKAKNPSTKVEVLPESQWYGEKPIASPPQLIKGLLPQTGVASIGGQSGTGKTFHGIHLATCLIPDCEQYHYIDRYKINRKGGVVFFALEGKSAFPVRADVAFAEVLKKQMEFGERHKLPFAFNSYEPNLFEKGPDALIKLIERDAQRMRKDFSVDLVAVFLDTMGLAACFENEDKAAQVLKVVAGLTKLSDATGALAIVIDHFGKNQQAGLRGSSAKRGGVETVLACICDRDKEGNAIDLRMWLEKIRDGEAGRIIPYRLKTVPWGVDEDGDPVTSCTIQWEPNRPPVKQGASRRKTDVTMEQALDAVALPAEPEVLRKAFYKHHGGNDRAANQAWHRAIKATGLVLVNGCLEFPRRAQ
jgi:AAA domain